MLSIGLISNYLNYYKTSYLVRLSLTILQMAAGGGNKNEEKSLLYVYMYFEMPYHIFNIVSYIVLMQWVQLWAILSEASN